MWIQGRQAERDSERDPQPPETGEEGPGPHGLTPAMPEGLPSWQRKDAAGGCGCPGKGIRMGSSGAAGSHPPKSSLLQQLLVCDVSAHPVFCTIPVAPLKFSVKMLKQAPPFKEFEFSVTLKVIHLKITFLPEFLFIHGYKSK